MPAATLEDTGIDVLLLDDDRAWHACFGRLATRRCDRVRTFGDADAALAAAREAQPDVFVCALELPNRDGFSVLRELRADARIRLVPVMVLSIHQDDLSRTAAFAAGADCFLAKGAPTAELAAAVGALARHGRRLRHVEPCEAVLVSLARLVDLHGLETLGHMERCARLAADFGRALGLSSGELLALERAGCLHDVGKIGVPWGVINKPGPLDPAERAEIERHPLIGERICEPLASMRDVLPLIRHHHERWDGSGYPDGLAGERIPFLARAFQVADMFDALTSRRPYKPPFPVDTALGILRDEALRGWRDPQLIESFARRVEAGVIGTR